MKPFFEKEKYGPDVIFSTHEVTNGEKNNYKTISAQVHTCHFVQKAPIQIP